jgi:hypothetical protein
MSPPRISGNFQEVARPVKRFAANSMLRSMKQKSLFREKKCRKINFFMKTEKNSLKRHFCTFSPKFPIYLPVFGVQTIEWYIEHLLKMNFILKVVL